LKNLKFEIQVRTILEEAWGEFTHPVYQDSNPPQFIIKSYQILSKFLDVTNIQVEFLKTTYRTLTKDQISKGTIEDVIYDGEKLHFLDLSNFTLKNSKFHDCRIFTSNFKSSNLYAIEFNRCELMNFDFTDAELKRVKFLNSERIGIMNFKLKCKIDLSEFKNLHMMNTDFGNVVCRNTTFEDIDFMNTDFFNAEFFKCSFKKVEFMNVFNITNLKFVECTFDQIKAFGRKAEEILKIINQNSQA
jgi:uncharacterized protein YjbI with pentapeptide repeats